MASSTSAAYLEFVRNLTPQIVFGTCFMLLRVSIDTDKLQLDWDGVKNAAALWSCGLLFIGAMLANMVRLWNPYQPHASHLRSKYFGFNAVNALSFWPSQNCFARHGDSTSPAFSSIY